MHASDPDRSLEVNGSFTASYRHTLRFTTGVLRPENATLVDVFSNAHTSDSVATHSPGNAPNRVLAFLDKGVLARQPDLPGRLCDYAQAHADRITLPQPALTVPGGERCKNDKTVFDDICRAIHDAKLCRHSFVLAIGGGAMLDAVGFAAAVAHRGIRLVRLPTTTLAQADAGVGVKNGINSFGKKNYLGTFAPPWAVINDADFLTTLDDRDWRAGFSEAVKVSLVKDPALFDRISTTATAITQRDTDAALPIIQRCARLHLQHIVEGGDPFESSKTRPLDFGHWSAHKLEQMTNYRLRHGEAVAIGIALDVAYSALLGMLGWRQAEAITQCLTDLGFSLHDSAVQDGATLLEGLAEFREHLGGPLCITLLAGIGRPVDVHEIDRDLMLRAIDHLQAQPACR